MGSTRAPSDSRRSRPSPLGIGADAAELAAAPALPTLDHEVTVVTDPHYNTLLSHEIIGHPVELDRGLKMEAAYAGRSWLLRGLDDHQVGKQVASPLVTAYSDPSLPGYGHYAYDHEGTPARRVIHIDRGVFRGFMNSRQTAAVFGGEPNGHWKSTDAALVPLIRMSSTVFAAGRSRPAPTSSREVDRGYYLVGHKIPSIAESRENFRISARKVYEISQRWPRPPVSGRRHHGRLAGLLDEGRRGGRRFSPLPHLQLRQGTTHADQEARQWRPHHAEPRHPHRRSLAMSRLCAACLVAVALFWVSPAPADDPEVPEKYMSVDRSMRSSREEAGHVHRRASQGPVRRAPHPRRQAHPLDRAAAPAGRPLQAGLPGPLLSVPTRVGPGGLQGAVPRGISQHGDPRRGPSGLGEKALPHGEDRGEELAADDGSQARGRGGVGAARRPSRAFARSRCSRRRTASLLARLNYTSHIPCNGVEEPKSTEMRGLGLQVVFDGPDGPLVGFGSEPSDFGEAGVRRALDKARRSAVSDPEFRSLPRPDGRGAEPLRLPRSPTASRSTTGTSSRPAGR